LARNSNEEFPPFCNESEAKGCDFESLVIYEGQGDLGGGPSKGTSRWRAHIRGEKSESEEGEK